ncbi:hypothetical protein Dxin01_01209 [Deinococcus xinjiangensis]|uniref:Uncharacterized protein n=1 Tax=Deinococcus xinjiangensis TaxID=457454 RepID=A0ABP9V870_9DEIO
MAVLEGFEPFLSHELPVSQEIDRFALQERHYRFEKFNTLLRFAVGTVRNECPGQREGETAPVHAENQEIDVLLTPFPIGAIHQEQQLLLLPQK